MRPWPNGPRAAVGSVRRRGDHRLERHRRRHPLHAAAGRGQHPKPRTVSVDLDRRRRAGVRRRDGLRGARRGPASRGRRIRLPRRRVRPARRVSHRLDVVRRRLLRRHRGQRRRVRLYLGRFVAGASDGTPLVTVPIPWVPLTVSRQTLVAVSVIALMAWIHVRGVGPGRIVGNALAALKVSAIMMFIALGFSVGAGSAANLESSAGTVHATSWLLALVPVMFTYAGWNAATYVAEEIRDPGRNIPARAGHGHARGDRHLLPAQSSLSLRRADRKPRRRAGQRAGCDRRQGARRPRGARDGRGVDRQPRRRASAR